MSTETIIKPYRLAAGKGIEDVWWMSGRITVKVGPEETGNAFSQFEVNDPRGSAPPVHVHHNDDEAFYVLDGEVTVLVGDERIDLGTGDYCFAPRGIRHTWIVRSERARMLVTISPSGTEQLFVSLGIPVTGSEPPTQPVMPPMPEVARLFGAEGVEILGPPPTLDDVS